MGWRRGRAARAMVAAGALVATIAVVPGPVGAAPAAPARRAKAAAPATPVPGTGAARPRILYDPGSEAALAARLEREPYRTVFVQEHQRADSWDDATLGDESITAQRDLTRAAKIRAFEYALDRTVVGGAVVPFATPADRQAAGDFVRDVLVQVYPRSRLAVPAPIGGWDRDISTSEEIVNAATAFDTLLAAGYPLRAPDRTEAVRRLRSVTQELWENFTDLSTADGITRLHQNNHRTKSGAAMAIAAVALADDVPSEQSRRWFDTGADYVDDVLRYILVTGDGAYAEGAHYLSYTLQNLVPFIGMWERQLGSGSWTTAAGLTIPALAHTPLFARTQRWFLDMTMPDGTRASFDDSYPGRSSTFGALPPGLPTASAAAWRWTHQPTPLVADGNVDLGPDSIVNFDDAVAAAPPTWAPTQFYVEGGDAVLRSGWGADATEALVLGEHDTASEFGRDRTGTARYPESHEHADPGSFVLHAFGQRLALDPGYLNFTDHTDVNQPEDHNVILVDGHGPADYLAASLNWGKDPTARPPAEGQSTITATLDSPAADTATVVTDYRGAQIARRFLFGEDRYLVVADDVAAPAGTPLTWMLHGNGGGTSGGTFDPLDGGGRWTIGSGRLTSGVATSARGPALTTPSAVHEGDDGQRRTHTALAAAVTAPSSGAVRALEVLYPTASGAPAPTVTRSTGSGASWVAVAAPDDDRTVTAALPAPGSTAPAATSGLRAGAGVLVVDRHTDGTLRSAWADGASTIASAGGPPLVAADGDGSLGLSLGADTADVVATGARRQITVAAVGFTPLTADGACGVEQVDGRTVLRVNREHRVTLHADAANARPAADPGPDQAVATGTQVHLDGTASCDAEGGPLTYAWELVSAPAGSAWSLQGATTARPTLRADRVGPYRVRLVVTDAAGGRSLEQEVTVIAGPRCGDGVDNDLDGRIDTDDPDCDGAGSGTTTTTTGSTGTTAPPVGPEAPAPTPAEAVPGRPRYTG